MYTLNRAPGIAIPGLDQVQPIRHDYGGIERGLSALGQGLASYLEEKQRRDALEEANNPKIEQLQRERAATQAELQRAQAETDQVLQSEAYNFVYDTPKPTPDMITPEKEAAVQSYLDFAKNQAPEQKRRGLEPATYVDAQPTVQESYYKVGQQEFSAPPDQSALEVITNQNKAKAVEAQDPRLAMAYEQKAQQALARKLQQTYLQLERTEDVPGAVRLYRDIPDGMTPVERQLPDGTWEVYLHPDGRPDEARLFVRGTSKDVFSAIRRSVDSDAFDRAAELQYNRGRQEQADQRAAQQEARYADNARRQELAGQLQYLQQREASATNQADFVRFSVLAEQTAARLYGMGQGGLSGQGAAGSPGAPTAGAVPPRAIFDYLVREKGLTPTQAVGVVTNIEAESGFDPTALHDRENGVPTGYGLFGHRLDRRDKLFAHAGNTNPSWTQQIDYLLTEPQMQQYLGQDYGTDAGAAAAGFTRLVEKPKDTEAKAAARAGMARNYASYLADAVPGATAARAPLTQVAQASVGALGTDFNAEWQARQGVRTAGGAAVDKTVRDQAIKSYFKNLDSIQTGLDSPDVQARKIEDLNERYAPLLGGAIPGVAGGLTAQEAALFGVPAASTAGRGGGAAGQPAASTGQPAPGEKASKVLTPSEQDKARERVTQEQNQGRAMAMEASRIEGELYKWWIRSPAIRLESRNGEGQRDEILQLIDQHYQHFSPAGRRQADALREYLLRGPTAREQPPPMRLPSR